MDPPRAGLDIKTRTLLLELAAPRLVYVSCDPATLARDLKALTAGGYTLAAVQPLEPPVRMRMMHRTLGASFL